MSHKSEVEAIRKLINALGGKFWLMSQGHRLRGSAGIPDIYIQMPLMWEQFTFWCEVKCGRDKPSAAQAEFIEAEKTCGGTIIVGGVAEVISYLKDQGVQIT